MSELRFTAAPPRDEMLRELRVQLLATHPAVEASGRLVLVVLGDGDRDLELLARGLAQRAWVEPRVGDWLQLAPELGVRPDTGVRLVLIAPRFGGETETAAAALGPDAPELWTYRCVRNGTGVAVLIEAPHPAQTAATASARPDAAPEPAPLPPEEPAGRFRTGLSEADLGLTPAERREFE